VSRPRKSPPPPKRGPRKPLPAELARDAIAHEDEAPGDKVYMTFGIFLHRKKAEALAAASKGRS
jgi:hypothetical protein